MLMNERLLEITKEMPMKLIEINGKPYLERYFVGYTGEGKELWLHHFLSADGDRHLHCHPYDFECAVLTGGYMERLLEVSGEAYDIARVADHANRFAVDDLLHRLVDRKRITIPGNEYATLFRKVNVFEWHRITAVFPDTWTVMVVSPPRLTMWYFRDDEGNIEPRRPSTPDWYLKYGNRAAGGKELA